MIKPPPAPTNPVSTPTTINAEKTLENSGVFDYIYINKIDTRARLP